MALVEQLALDYLNLCLQYLPADVASYTIATNIY